MKLTKNDLKSLIKEELSLMNEELLKEEYDALLKEVEQMSFEELREAVLGKLLGKQLGRLGGAVKGVARKGLEAGKAAVGKVAGVATDIGRNFMQDLEAAQKEELQQIIAAAEQKAKESIKKVVQDFTVQAAKKNIPNPEEVLKIIWQEVMQDLSDQITVQPPPASGIPRPAGGPRGAQLGAAGMKESKITRKK